MGPVVLTATHLGEGSFYRVVPYVAMTIPPILIALYGLVVFTVGASRFWRETGAGVSDVINLAALWHATRDAFGLAYMKGGGAGCNYPNETFSQFAASVPSHGVLRIPVGSSRDQRSGLL
jgi:citrate/tricarballylate utilization protein